MVNTATNGEALRLHRTILPTDYTGLPLREPVFGTITKVDSVPGMPLAVALQYSGELTQALGQISEFAEESLILTDETDTDVKSMIVRRLRLERPSCVMTLTPEVPEAGSAIQCNVSWANWLGTLVTNVFFALRWYGAAGPLDTTTGSNGVSIARIEPGATWTNSFVLTQSARNPGFAHATLLHERHVLAQADIDIPVVGPHDLEFIRESDGRCYLRFDSRANFVYRVEYADRLEGSAWKSLGKVLGLGGRMDVRVPSPSQSALRFYRLHIVSFSP